MANISALLNTFYSLFSKFFYLIYSRKYDHYKIFKNILLLDATIKKTNSLFLSEASNLKLNNYLIDKKSVDEKTLEAQVIQVINSNKSDSSSTNNNDKRSECPTNEKEEKDDDNESNHLKLSKLPLTDFILNNFYSGKCCSSNKQKLITLGVKFK